MYVSQEGFVKTFRGLIHQDYKAIYVLPICSMVLEYLPTFAQTKSPSYVGKYTSTMEHMGTYKVTIIIIGIIIPLTIWLGYL